jgi:hypothetical protein
LFRDWQRTQTQSSVTALAEPETANGCPVLHRMRGPSAVRHSCATLNPDQRNARSPERAQRPCVFFLTLTYMDVGYAWKCDGPELSVRHIRTKGVSGQVDSEQANLRVARYSPTIGSSTFDFPQADFRPATLHLRAQLVIQQRLGWKCREHCRRHLCGELLEDAHRTRETAITQMDQPQVTDAEMPIRHHLDELALPQQLRLYQWRKVANAGACEQCSRQARVIIHAKVSMKRESFFFVPLTKVQTLTGFQNEKASRRCCSRSWGFCGGFRPTR